MKNAKNTWWFSGANDRSKNFDDEYDTIYYGNETNDAKDNTETHNEDAYGNYDDPDSGDVRIVMSEEPAEEVAKAEPEPLMKRTFTPKDCQDSKAIVDAYKEGRVIVICIEELDKPNFYRVFDYLMGAVHALDGELRRIDRETVVLVPYGVGDEISIDDLEEEKVPEKQS